MTNELKEYQGELVQIPSQPLQKCSKAVALLLTDDKIGWREAIQRISANKDHSNEVAAIASELAVSALPLNRESLFELLARKRIMFGVPETEQALWGELWTPYLDALSEFSIAALEDAFLRWNRAEMYPKEPGRHAFYPKPAELCWLAKDHQTKLQMAAYRAKMAAEKAASEVEWTPERKAEERRKAIEMGVLTPDGRFPKLALKGFEPPPKPMTPAQVAELNRMAAQGPDEEIEAI